MRLMALLTQMLVIALLVGCGAAATATPTTSTGATSPTASSGLGAATPGTSASARPVASGGLGTGASSSPAGGPLRKVTIGLGYIPDIQFAPFYVAREKGYFREEGLEVEFMQGFETDVLKLLGTGTLSFGMAGGDEVLVARSQGVPLVYVASLYQKYPVSVVALESANIRTVADLKGRTIGVPGRFGATYVGLLALLDSAGLKVTDVDLREVGFSQVQALTQKQVDAVVGYSNNEPIQLQALGEAITTINVFDHVDLISNGLIINEQTQRDDPELVRKVVRAVLRGFQDTLADPEEAITLSIPTIPGSAEKRDQLQAVLNATLPIFQGGPVQGFGYNDPKIWSSSHDLLRKLGVLGSTVDLDKTYTNDFLP